MYVDIGPFPFRNYLTLTIAGISLFEIRELGIKKFFSKYQLGILLIIYPLIRLLFEENIKSSLMFYLKDSLKFGTLGISLIYLLSKTKIKKINIIILSIVALSFFVAFLQSVSPELGWKIRFFIEGETFNSLNNPGSRPAGLAYYTLTLAEHIMLAYPLFFNSNRRFKK